VPLIELAVAQPEIVRHVDRAALERMMDPAAISDRRAQWSIASCARTASRVEAAAACRQRLIAMRATAAVNRALAFIDCNLDERLTLLAIAGVLAVSPYRLARVFKRAMAWRRINT